MKVEQKGDTTTGVAPVEAKRLSVIDVSKGRTSRVLTVEHDRAVAAIVPIADRSFHLQGALRDTVALETGTDLAEPTGESWAADL